VREPVAKLVPRVEGPESDPTGSGSWPVRGPRPSVRRSRPGSPAG
jgi:hypothetical protein